MKKADDYTKALALDPEEPFNVVFAAAFAAGDGGERARAALKVAEANEDLMCASYNLAAIHAQLGDRNKALALLKRHFFEYEKYDAVRSKEMMEARVDAVFASIIKDPSSCRSPPVRTASCRCRAATKDQHGQHRSAARSDPGAESRKLNGVQVDVVPGGNGPHQACHLPAGFRCSTHMKHGWARTSACTLMSGSLRGAASVSVTATEHRRVHRPAGRRDRAWSRGLGER